MSDLLKSIVVVGGGSAGWLTAGLLAAEHRVRRNTDLSVTLIESPDVGPIGVGEGTWPTMRLSLEKIGVSESNFVRHCEASFKQGTRFHGWVTGGDEHYYHPFTPPLGFNEMTLGEYWWPHREQVSFAGAVTAFSSQATRDSCMSAAGAFVVSSPTSVRVALWMVEPGGTWPGP